MAEHPVYQLPSLNFRGTPMDIDVIKVIEAYLLSLPLEVTSSGSWACCL